MIDFNEWRDSTLLDFSKETSKILQESQAPPAIYLLISELAARLQERLDTQYLEI